MGREAGTTPCASPPPRRHHSWHRRRRRPVLGRARRRPPTRRRRPWRPASPSSAPRSPGLRDEPPAARRRAQGRHAVHERPRRADRAARRGRLHGGLVLRERDEDLGRRAHREGPRRGPRPAATSWSSRTSSTAGSRSTTCGATCWPGGPASLEVCALLVKEGEQRVELDLALRRVHDPARVRRRLRARRRRALPQPPGRPRLPGRPCGRRTG